jgi:oligopeptide transport system ATP-binding protein
MTPATPALLQVRELGMHYRMSRGWLQHKGTVHALEAVSFDLAAGETLAVVGESGCGKSTLAKCILGLVEPTSGEVRLEGDRFSGKGTVPPRALRHKMQVVFQDPYASLNPRRTVYQTVADPLRLAGAHSSDSLRSRVAEALQQVGLGPDFMERHPHELSGGQRQRVAIARAIITRPRVVICDEPISSLDISIQAQVINLLKRLQRELGMAYLFITHDLRLVPHIADQVLVMYLGEVVEMAPASGLTERRLHPYSQALFSAVPRLNPGYGGATQRIILEGEVPSPMNPPSGCRFHTRCPQAQARCREEAPALRPVDQRSVRCHFAGIAGFSPETA